MEILLRKLERTGEVWEKGFDLMGVRKKKPGVFVEREKGPLIEVRK